MMLPLRSRPGVRRAPHLRTAVAVLAVGAAFLRLDAQSPDSAATMRLANEAVAAVNSGDTARVRAFVAGRGAACGSQLATMWRQSGGVTVRSAERFGAGLALTLWARRADAGVMFYVAADPADAGRLARCEVLRWFHPAATVRLTGPRAAMDAILREVTAEGDRLAAADEFAGTIAIGRRGRVIYQRGFGLADRRAGAPNGPDTRFHIASVGKSFTAVAVGQLVEAGRLSLDDSLARLLPDLPWRPAARGVTVRELLGHRSGLGQGDHVADSLERAWVAGAEPAFAPGTRWAYSNDGFLILARIVERISGEPFLAYLRRHVWDPAGMRSPGDTAGAIGYGHSDDDLFGVDPLVANTARVHGAGNGAGGEYATAADLVRFAAAVSGGRLLRRATLDSLIDPRAASPFGGPYPDERYALGFVLSDPGGRPAFGNAGGGLGWGICTRVDGTRDGEWQVAVASNADPPECEALARAILAALVARTAGR